MRWAPAYNASLSLILTQSAQLVVVQVAFLKAGAERDSSDFSQNGSSSTGVAQPLVRTCRRRPAS
jgi:hypothetical protein